MPMAARADSVCYQKYSFLRRQGLRNRLFLPFICSRAGRAGLPGTGAWQMRFGTPWSAGRLRNIRYHYWQILETSWLPRPQPATP